MIPFSTGLFTCNPVSSKISRTAHSCGVSPFSNLPPTPIHLPAQIYVLTEAEGGRKKPFFSGYRPQFYFRTTDITGTIELEANVQMVKPGDNVKIIGELIHPIAMDEGLKLAIREGGHTIASGQVTKIIE